MKQITGWTTNDNRFFINKEDAEKHEKRLWYQKLLKVEFPKHIVKGEQEREMLITSVGYLMSEWGKGLKEFMNKYDF